MAFLSPSPMELVVILVIGLLVLGPKRLPETARSLGRGLRELRDTLQGIGQDDEEDKEDEDDEVTRAADAAVDSGPPYDDDHPDEGAADRTDTDAADAEPARNS